MRGVPGRFGDRFARAAAIPRDEANAAPLSLLQAVLSHQGRRAQDPTAAAQASSLGATAAARREAGLWPLLDLEPARDLIAAELGDAIAALSGLFPAPVPEGLAEAGRLLTRWSDAERSEAVASWLDDPTLVDPRAGFWIGVGAGPILEGAAALVPAVGRQEWSGAACPVCGGPPQVSVIAEESGEFMAGSPRSLICSRCATWWPFARAVCPFCGEDDSRRIEGFSAQESAWARVDCCDSCRAYVKTFDLRVPGAREVVPLVDDVATLVLDLWANEHGYGRTTISLAGV